MPLPFLKNPRSVPDAISSLSSFPPGSPLPQIRWSHANIAPNPNYMPLPFLKNPRSVPDAISSLSHHFLQGPLCPRSAGRTPISPPTPIICPSPFWKILDHYLMLYLLSHHFLQGPRRPRSAGHVVGPPCLPTTTCLEASSVWGGSDLTMPATTSVLPPTRPGQQRPSLPSESMVSDSIITQRPSLPSESMVSDSIITQRPSLPSESMVSDSIITQRPSLPSESMVSDSIITQRPSLPSESMVRDLSVTYGDSCWVTVTQNNKHLYCLQQPEFIVKWLIWTYAPSLL